MEMFDYKTAQKKYAGKWIALTDDRKKIVAAGQKAKTVFDRAKQTGMKKPTIMRLPREILSFVGYEV